MLYRWVVDCNTQQLFNTSGITLQTFVKGYILEMGTIVAWTSKYLCKYYPELSALSFSYQTQLISRLQNCYTKVDHKLKSAAVSPELLFAGAKDVNLSGVTDNHPSKKLQLQVT